MGTAAGLPLPALSRGRFAWEGDLDSPVAAYTDEALFEATGVRVAFTERKAGFSAPPYDSLNLAMHVGDDPADVQRNRDKLASALGFEGAQVITPNQVHGTKVVCVEGTEDEQLEEARTLAAAGADAVVVPCPDVAAMLFSADCVLLAMVAPNGMFSVVHAGWRGVYTHVAVEALRALCAQAACAPSDCNVYLGPYLHAECFEVSHDLQRKFEVAFGPTCTPDERHVDLGAALRTQLAHAGALRGRVASVGLCTSCERDRFFSYRAQNGICGRIAAVAFRLSASVR